MKIAAYRYQGQAGVGRVSADGQMIEPFQLGAVEAALGALPLLPRWPPPSPHIRPSPSP